MAPEWSQSMPIAERSETTPMQYAKHNARAARVSQLFTTPQFSTCVEGRAEPTFTSFSGLPDVTTKHLEASGEDEELRSRT